MYVLLTIKNFSDLVSLNEKLGSNYIFRGLNNRKYGLKPSIERIAEKFKSSFFSIPDQENYILREFQKRAQHYLQILPLENEIIDWYSLMQHHGAPTRLLDFTTSIYIATFFAVENADEEASIFAVNSTLLDAYSHLKIAKLEHGNFGRQGYEITDYKRTLMNKYLLYTSTAKRIVNGELKYPNDDEILLFSVEPKNLSERMSIQRGEFIISSNITVPFEKSFTKHMRYEFNSLSEENAQEVDIDFLLNMNMNKTEVTVIKIILPNNLLNHFLLVLDNMNINSSTLFPGIDGFAHSLNLFMRMSEKNDYDDEEV